MIRLALIFLIFLCWPCLAENEWTVEGNQDLPPTNPENRIIKWCKLDGSHVRFASANLKLKGYEPCGKLTSHTSCDAGGTRMISKDANRPSGHLDCGRGPRIQISRDGVDLLPTPGDEAIPSDYYLKQLDEDYLQQLPEEEKNKTVRAMSPAEVYQMQKEMERAQRQAEKNDPFYGLEKKFEKMLKDLPQKYEELEKALK